jgi:hypothetical protein
MMKAGIFESLLIVLLILQFDFFNYIQTWICIETNLIRYFCAFLRYFDDFVFPLTP